MVCPECRSLLGHRPGCPHEPDADEPDDATPLLPVDVEPVGDPDQLLGFSDQPLSLEDCP